MNFHLSLCLNKYKGARIVELKNEETLQMEEGVFIPIKENDINVSSNGFAYSVLVVKQMMFPQGDSTHRAYPLSGTKEEKDKIYNFDYVSSYYVGKMRPFKY